MASVSARSCCGVRNGDPHRPDGWEVDAPARCPRQSIHFDGVVQGGAQRSVDAADAPWCQVFGQLDHEPPDVDGGEAPDGAVADQGVHVDS